MDVSGGRRQKRRTLSRDALLHEGMRLIKGLGWKIKTNVKNFSFVCQNGGLTRRPRGEEKRLS